MSDVRLIDAEALCRHAVRADTMSGVTRAVSLGCILHAPTIEPPVVRGEWIDWKDKFGFKGTIVFCSVCDNHSDYKSRYCSNCGAKMEATP